jgi:hypothetical protein
MNKIHVRVSLPKQRLSLLKGSITIASYAVSTAKNGAGERNGSGCTPRGLHEIYEKIGADAPLNSVFVGRRLTGEIYSPALAAQVPQRDWILTRILWLNGLEPGHNRHGALDTLQRYIYIHGCPDELPLGIPLSHGCIRMNNQAIVELFQQLSVGDRVMIEDK